jgi:surface polysaccharide O-acyltransferase-like enzyme
MRNQRNFSMDILRVLACFLVMWQHVSEYYYISPEGLPVKAASTYLIGYITSLDRCCVGLFVMISGYFLLPIKDSVDIFFRKRLNRIVWPFIFWGVIYAIYNLISRGDTLVQCLTNMAHIFVNFGTELGHMWFVYMLIGIYLLAPVLSPWLQTANKKTLQLYLAIWLVASALPYIHLVYPKIWGECFWNPTPMLYYFTGFGGYFILGFYLRKYGYPSRIASVFLILIGYIITSLVYITRIETAETVASLELSWGETNINVIMMAVGIYGLVCSLQWKGQNLLGRLVTDNAVKGYGIYLAHVLVLSEFAEIFVGKYDSVLIEIPLITIMTFVMTYLLITVMSYLPKSKYWLG